jgi:hypothetical protein
MKLQDYEQTAATGAGALSVSLKDTDDDQFEPVKRSIPNSIQEEENLWQQISDELANDASPAWRMWR